MSIANTLSVMDENYLIALSNKGTLKKARKELDETTVELTINEDSIEAKFTDGTTLILTEDIKKYKCTCPARDVCKHVIMGILAFQKQVGDKTTDNTETQEIIANFDKLLNENGSTLERKAGKQVTRKAFFQVEIDGTAEIAESSILSVTLAGGFKIHFLPDCGIEDAKCSCKSSGICTHKVEAVLHYIQFKTGCLPEGMAEKISQPATDDLDMDSLSFMQDFVAKVLETGLARIPANIKQQFEHLGVIAHSRKYAYLENITKRITAQLELIEAKSARANTYSLLNNLCEFINVCKILRSGKVNKELLGAFRNEYNMIPPITLHGLGAEGWRSDTGYIGITSYFYCDERQEILQYSSVLPTDFQSDLNAIYKNTEIPALNSYITKLCRATIKLVSGKLSLKKRLSFTKDTKGTVWDNTGNELIQSLAIRDFSQIPDFLWQGEERTFTAVIAPVEYSDYNFDSIEQRLTICVRDQDGKKLWVGLKYKDSDKLLIHNLQEFMRVKDNTEQMLVKAFVENGKLRLFPLVIYSENKIYSNEKVNLSLDKLLK